MYTKFTEREVRNPYSVSYAFQTIERPNLIFDLRKQHTLVRKFDTVFDIVNSVLKKHKELSELYEQYLCDFDSGHLSHLNLVDRTTELCRMIDKCSEEDGMITYSYEIPKKTPSIHIDETEYKVIMYVSMRLKFLCPMIILYRESNMNFVRMIYLVACKELNQTKTSTKLENIVESAVVAVATRGLDYMSQLWTVIATSKGLDPYNVAIRERNNMFYKGIPTIKPGSDPLKYLVSMVKTPVEFEMKNKISNINIATNIPIESTYETSVDVLQTFISDEVTSNRQLVSLFAIDQYEGMAAMVKKNVAPITYYITSPFLALVLDTHTVNMTFLSNPLLVNLFTHKFLYPSNTESDLFRLLLYTVDVREFDTDNMDPVYAYCKSQLGSKIKQKMDSLLFDKVSIYAPSNLKNSFGKNLKTMFSYRYFNKKEEEILLNVPKIVDEYIQYIYDLAAGTLGGCIENAKSFLVPRIPKQYLEEEIDNDS